MGIDLKMFSCGGFLFLFYRYRELYDISRFGVFFVGRF